MEDGMDRGTEEGYEEPEAGAAREGAENTWRSYGQSWAPAASQSWQNWGSQGHQDAAQRITWSIRPGGKDSYSLIGNFRVSKLQLTDQSAEERFATMAGELPYLRQAQSLTAQHVLWLETLDLGENQLGDRAVRSLVTALKAGNVVVEIVKLHKNRIGMAGGQALSKLLRHSKNPPRELHLSHNFLDRQAVRRILEELSRNPAYPIRKNKNDPPTPLWLRVERQRVQWEGFREGDDAHNYAHAQTMIVTACEWMGRIRAECGLSRHDVWQQEQTLCMTPWKKGLCGPHRCSLSYWCHRSKSWANTPMAHVPYLWNQGSVGETLPMEATLDQVDSGWRDWMPGQSPAGGAVSASGSVAASDTNSPAARGSSSPPVPRVPAAPGRLTPPSGPAATPPEPIVISVESSPRGSGSGQGLGSPRSEAAPEPDRGVEERAWRGRGQSRYEIGLGPETVIDKDSPSPQKPAEPPAPAESKAPQPVAPQQKPGAESKAPQPQPVAPVSKAPPGPQPAAAGAATSSRGRTDRVGRTERSSSPQRGPPRRGQVAGQEFAGRKPEHKADLDSSAPPNRAPAETETTERDTGGDIPWVDWNSGSAQSAAPSQPRDRSVQRSAGAPRPAAPAPPEEDPAPFWRPWQAEGFAASGAAAGPEQPQAETELPQVGSKKKANKIKQ